ncbi:MAG TPA: YfiR family protein [Tepidisphaeraceae bacterium]|jgi:hypothetical protein
MKLLERKRSLFTEIAAVIVTVAMLGAGRTRAGSPTRLDAGGKVYEIKAAFIYNFAQFTQWPDSAFTSGDSPFVLAFIGDSELGPALQQVLQGKSIAGHPIVLKHLDSASQISGCHLLFIPDSEESHLDDIFNAVGNQPILTVGETTKFMQAGGIIRFFIADGRIRFEIDPDAADKATLRLSSRLMSLATIFKKQ